MVKMAVALIFDIVKKLLLKVVFKTVLDRFVNRVFLLAGDRLVNMTSNDLDDKTWQDIKDSLHGKRLKDLDG